MSSRVEWYRVSTRGARGLDDDSHMKTRLCQYEAYNGMKGIEIAKQLVLGKLQGQNVLFEKYGFELQDLDALQRIIDGLDHSSLESLRKRLTGVERRFTERALYRVASIVALRLVVTVLYLRMRRG